MKFYISVAKKLKLKLKKFLGSNCYICRSYRWKTDSGAAFPLLILHRVKVNETILYDLRIRNEIYARNPKTLRYGTEILTMPFLSSKIWAFTPQIIQDSSSLPCFEKKIRELKSNCPYRLCKTFLKNVDFI